MPDSLILYVIAAHVMVRDIVAPPRTKIATMNSLTHESLKNIVILDIQVGIVFI